jgi:hypothetical protein
LGLAPPGQKRPIRGKLPGVIPGMVTLLTAFVNPLCCYGLAREGVLGCGGHTKIPRRDAAGHATASPAPRTADHKTRQNAMASRARREWLLGAISGEAQTVAAALSTYM